MRYWVYHQGVPLGSADLRGSDLLVGDFDPTEAYLSVRGLVREASVAVWNLISGYPEEFQARVSPDALARAARLPLELRDAEGRMVAADFVNVVERPHTEEGPVVFTRFRHSHASVPSTVRPPNTKGGGASDPDA